MTNIPPGFANIVVTGTTAGTDRPWAISCGASIAALSLLDVQEVATNMGNSDYLDNASSDIVMQQVDFVIGTSDPTAPIHMPWSIAQSGGSGASGGPQVAWLVRKQTNLGGRKGRGRTYFHGVTEASVGTGGQIVEGDGSLRNGLENFWAGTTADVESITGLFLLHTDSTAPTEIQDFSLDGRVATQRRRLRK